MKTEEGDVLVRYRLDQAQTALDDARFLLEGGRSAMSIVNLDHLTEEDQVNAEEDYQVCVRMLARAPREPKKPRGKQGE